MILKFYRIDTLKSTPLLGLPTNIRLGWKQMAVANALTYHGTATVAAVKKFYSSDTSGLYYSNFTIVIINYASVWSATYDRNLRF